MKKNLEPWYAAKCLFVHKMVNNKGKRPKYTYEERIILVKARNFDKAIEKAENEAKRYCKALEPDNEPVKYTEYIDVFHLFEDQIKELTEIFSTMTVSNIPPRKFIDLVYPKEMNNCEKHGYEHYWFKSDNIYSKCRNCKTIKKGKLWLKKNSK